MGQADNDKGCDKQVSVAGNSAVSLMSSGGVFLEDVAGWLAVLCMLLSLSPLIVISLEYLKRPAVVAATAAVAVPATTANC